MLRRSKKRPLVLAQQHDWCFMEEPATTECKHTTHDCAICGTTDRRDALHRTRGGTGAVARLSKQNQKGKKDMPIIDTVIAFLLSVPLWVYILTHAAGFLGCLIGTCVSQGSKVENREPSPIEDQQRWARFCLLSIPFGSLVAVGGAVLLLAAIVVLIAQAGLGITRAFGSLWRQAALPVPDVARLRVRLTKGTREASAGSLSVAPMQDKDGAMSFPTE